MAHSLGIRTNILPRNAPRAISSIYNSSSTVVFSGRQNPQSQQCRRPFSQSKPAEAKGGMMSAETLMPKMPPERSFRARLRDMDPESIPTDFGVLPGTFIKPEGKDMPSLFKQPRDRLSMEWVWIKTWFTSALQTILYHKWYSKPRIPLNVWGRKNIGMELHQSMYTQFARGNEQWIRARCSPGLAQDLIKRIRKRNPKESLSWSLERYNRTPSTFFRGVRVLSDRAVAIPDMPDSGIRQIILRISSQQRSQKRTKNESDALSKGAFTIPKIQDCTEYVVIQKVRIAGREKEWEIWGFAKPTTLDELDSPFFASGMSVKDRLQSMQDMISGKS